MSVSTRPDLKTCLFFPFLHKIISIRDGSCLWFSILFGGQFVYMTMGLETLTRMTYSTPSFASVRQ